MWVLRLWSVSVSPIVESVATITGHYHGRVSIVHTLIRCHYPASQSEASVASPDQSEASVASPDQSEAGGKSEQETVKRAAIWERQTSSLKCFGWSESNWNFYIYQALPTNFIVYQRSINPSCYVKWMLVLNLHKLWRIHWIHSPHLKSNRGSLIRNCQATTQLHGVLTFWT